MLIDFEQDFPEILSEATLKFLMVLTGGEFAYISATFHLIAASTEIDQCCAVGSEETAGV